nr:hypothetical protein [Tanacetum cinerariifolium]
MDTTIDQQVAMDEALVPHAQRLRIGRSNFCLLSDIKSKESALQLVYDVMHLCSFFKPFLVIADVPEIYMQELWATATVHHHAIRFKMDNKKHIVNLESFRDMLHICPRVHGQSFAKPSFEEEILALIRFHGHSAAIRTLTDVNINKLYHPWRSFAAIINKCLTRKSSGYDSLRLSQAQIMWGLYHKRNLDYTYLMWEDFVYQVIIHHFMSKDPSIPRRNKVNWHYIKDGHMFSTIKLVSRHQNIQQFGALLPIELTNEEIRDSNAYKDYYAYDTREATPKPKANARRKRSGADSSTTPPTAVATLRSTIAAALKLTAAAKGKQPAKATKAKSLFALSEPGGLGTDEGTGSKPGVLDVPTDDSKEELSWNSSDDKGTDTHEKDRDDDEGDEGDESDDGEEDDAEDKDGEEKDDDDDDDQEIAKTDEQDVTERGGDDNEKSKSDKESDDEETRDEESFDPIPRTSKESEDDGNDKEEHGLKTSEEERLTKEEEADELYRDVDINQGRGIQVSQEIKDSHVTLTLVNPNGKQESSLVSSQFVSSQAPIPPTTFPSEILQHLLSFGSLFCFDEKLKALEANFLEFSQTHPFAKAVSTIPSIVQQYMNQQMTEAKIIKEQVKSQVKDQVSRILLRIEQSVNAQLEAEVLTRSSHSSRTSYIVAANLSEMELKKILIKKWKAISEGPSAGSDRGSKRQREGKEPESASAPLEPTTRSAGSELAKQADSRSSFNELLDTLLDFSNFIMNWLKVDTLTPELLAGPTYELIKGSCKSLTELECHLEEVYKDTTDQLDWVNLKVQQRIIAVTDLKIVEWHSCKHLEWISDVYKEYCHPAMRGRSSTGSRKLPEEAQPYQARHVPVQSKAKGGVYYLFKPTRIHLSKQGQENRLMRIDELHKFSDGTLNDVRTALDDHLKGIRMQYLPHTIWRKGDKDKAAAMIQAIDKILKISRIMRSLEKFVGGRLYEGDFWMLQQTI